MDDDLKKVVPLLIILILLVQVVSLNAEVGELKKDLRRLKSQQEEYSRVIWSEYGRDVYAAIEHLRKTRPDVVETLGNASLTVKSISTRDFYASYDAREGVFWVWYEPHKYIEKDIVYVQLTAYYPNGTEVRAFEFEYLVNHTTGEVLGVSEYTAESIVERTYWKLRKNVTESMGLRNITETCRRSIGVIPKDGMWLVVEMECSSGENLPLCWFVMGEVDRKTGVLKRLEITLPWVGGCGRENERGTLNVIEDAIYDNAPAQEIKRDILNMTGGLMFNLTFSNP